MIRNIHLIRHAESEANVKGIVCGQLDVSLSQEGIQQIYSLRNRIEYFLDISIPCFCSPLTRAKNTAELLGFNNIKFDPRLMETNTGDLSLNDLQKTSHLFPQFKHYSCDLDAQYPNGESTMSMILRSYTCILDILNNPHSNSIAIVAHAGPLNAIMCKLLGTDIRSFPCFSLNNASVTTLMLRNTDLNLWSLERFNS